jgi:hypothetical protein
MSPRRVFGSGIRWKRVRPAVIVLCLAVFVGWVVVQRQRREYAERTHCVSNLVFIKLAKAVCKEDLRLAEGDSIPEDALQKAILSSGLPSAALRCPNGGSYAVGAVGTLPKCTYTNFCYTWDLEKSPPWLKRRAWKHSLGP